MIVKVKEQLYQQKEEWISVGDLEYSNNELINLILVAESEQAKNPVQVLRRGSYMMDRLKNRHRNHPDFPKAEWLRLNKGVVMRHHGRQHIRYFIDSRDSIEETTFIMEQVENVRRSKQELRFVVDSAFKPEGGVRSFENGVLRYL